jgi:Radical SAM proteins, N-terminal
MLRASGIPVTWRERADLDRPNSDGGLALPLVFAGGPTATSNPEPFADFFDFFALGDGAPCSVCPYVCPSVRPSACLRVAFPRGGTVPVDLSFLRRGAAGGGRAVPAGLQGGAARQNRDAFSAGDDRGWRVRAAVLRRAARVSHPPPHPKIDRLPSGNDETLKAQGGLPTSWRCNKAARPGFRALACTKLGLLQ